MNLFNKVQNELQKVEAINDGGCGIAALVLYEAAILEGKNPKIVYLYGDWEYEKKMANKGFKQGKITNAESCMHIVIELEEGLIDCNGSIGNNWDTSDKDYVTKEHLIASLTWGGWNSVFDRKKWYPKIKQILADNIVLPELPLEYVGGGKFDMAKY